MSHFVTTLVVRELQDDSGAELLDDFVYQSDHLGRLVTVPKGFTTDYASVPRLPFAYSLFGGVAKWAAVIHDYMYRTAQTTRADTDAVFREAMGASGISSWRRGFMWAGVRVFGGSSYCGPQSMEVPDEDVDPYRDVRGS